MRDVLVDYARSRRRLKRGSEAVQISLSESAILSEEKSAESVALDEALSRPRAVDPRKGRVAEMRYLAEDPRLGRKVALKLLPRDLKNDSDRVRRFRTPVVRRHLGRRMT
jgi:hypothetical protein